MNKSILKRMEPRPAELAIPRRREGERSEPDRSAGMANSGDVSAALVSAPDSEIVATAKRRQFTTEYKRSIQEQADACRESGAIGALLRREGLYSSLLSKWRQQRQRFE